MSAAFAGDGRNLESGAAMCVTYVYGDALAIDSAFFVADKAYRVIGITGRSTIAGTNGGAVTAAVMKAPSGTALSAGTALQQSTINLKTTADTNFSAVSLTATTADLTLAAGDCVGLDVTGTTTAARGVVCVFLQPLA